MPKFKVQVERKMVVWDIAEIEVEAENADEAQKLAETKANETCPANYRTTDPVYDDTGWYANSCVHEVSENAEA